MVLHLSLLSISPLSHILYFVHWVHWCQLWRISATQLFNTVNGELVSCLGRKNRDSQLNQHLSAQPASLICLLLGSKLFQGIATMTYTRSHTWLSQKALGCVVYPLNNKYLAVAAANFAMESLESLLCWAGVCSASALYTTVWGGFLSTRWKNRG